MRREPVIVGALARVVALLVARYGVDLSADQIIALWLAVEPILAVLTRMRTSPFPKPEEPEAT